LFNTFGLPELLVVLVFVLLIFGVGRISKVAGELGNAIRQFREGLQGKSDDQRETDDDSSKKNS